MELLGNAVITFIIGVVIGYVLGILEEKYQDRKYKQGK